MKIPCEGKHPDCLGFRVLHRNRKLTGSLLPLCAVCLKEHTRRNMRDYQRRRNWGGLDPSEIIEVPCTVKGCTVKRKVVRHRAKQAKYCLDHARKMQSAKVTESNRTLAALRKKPARLKGKGRICQICGEDPSPNYFFCKSCHPHASKAAGNCEENPMPHVPMSSQN